MQTDNYTNRRIQDAVVAKINVGKMLWGSLNYNAKKVEEGVAKTLATNKIFYPLDGQLNPYKCMKDFENYMPSHFRTENPVITISLNPHPNDKLTDSQFTDIAREYMDRLGYGNQPYIIYKHEDIERAHVHIISLRVDEKGRKINDRFEHKRSKDITRLLERKYGLTPAEKTEKRASITLNKVDISRGDIQQQMANIIPTLASRYHYLSFNEYNALLSIYNITAQQVKGVQNDKPYNGIVYSATDNKGNKTSNPLKSTEFTKSAGYEALQNKFESSKEQIKSNGIATKTIISHALRSSSTKEQFETELKDRGIDVILRYSDAGRLYGTTFIDHNNHCVFNGSRLGKDLSANAISYWFENPQVAQPDPQQRQIQDVEFSHQQDSYDNNFSLGGLFDMPIDGGVDDPEEERFRRAMQRKKRKKKIKYKL